MIQRRLIASFPLLYLDQPKTLPVPYIQVIKNVYVNLNRQYKETKEAISKNQLIVQEPNTIQLQDSGRPVAKENHSKKQFKKSKRNRFLLSSTKKKNEVKKAPLSAKQQLQIVKSWPSYIPRPSLEIQVNDGIIVGICNYVENECFDITNENGKFIRRVKESEIRKVAVVSSSGVR